MKKNYQEIIDNIVLFLEGRQEVLLKKLFERMIYFYEKIIILRTASGDV